MKEYSVIWYGAETDNRQFLKKIEYHSKFIKPAKYDDLLTIKTTIKELPSVRIKFEYEVINQSLELLCKGETTLVFVKSDSKRPCAAPIDFMESIKKFF